MQDCQETQKIMLHLLQVVFHEENSTSTVVKSVGGDQGVTRKENETFQRIRQILLLFKWKLRFYL